jgi:hypothetical protein
VETASFDEAVGVSRHSHPSGVVRPTMARASGGFLGFLGRILLARHPVKMDQTQVRRQPENLEEKLAQIQPRFQNTHAVYEKRITELEEDLATKAEINRELIRAKIQVLQQSMEMETRRTF